MHEMILNRKERDIPSLPERELHSFIGAVAELFGREQSEFLKEIWLDELASMDAMPGPTSSDWRKVTLAAWARLAHRLIDVGFMNDFSHPVMTTIENGFFYTN